MSLCWHCGKETGVSGKVPFRAICEGCDAYLHCCKNCKHYKVGRANDCLIPGTEFVADREKFNYCEDFSLKGEAPPPKPNLSDLSSRFFHDELP